MDNASIHHRDLARYYMMGSFVAEKIGLEFLPIYSPFLNPFGLLKSRLWRSRLNASVTDESKSMLKRNLTDQVMRITNDDGRQYYFHVEHFLKYAEDRSPVFTQQLHEASHSGDKTGLYPMPPERIDHLLDSYLPDRYTEFTPEDQADVEQSYGFKRPTMTMIDEMVVRHNSAEVSDTGVATSNTASEVEYQFGIPYGAYR
ncbi:unnamed protein product [Phytophthora fragariaefolia]|uniref:Unnamed protein product n=1 Tax=Phytophthora fragariaefolia TaxID=1490495 RepID=A0A9W7D7B0_9STRA|nr:unnamed protein product [Phytophthora fragariaefolia]